MSVRDRLVLRLCGLVMRAASDKTQARVTVALMREQKRLVPADLLRRAAFHEFEERVP